MSAKRTAKRQDKQPAKGKPVPLHKRKVVKDRMNKGGFYEGMPGATIDDNGYRKMIDFVVTPEGDNNAILYAAPPFAKTCVLKAMQEHKELRSLMMSAFVDFLFKSKRNPLYWFIRILFKAKVAKQNRKYNKLKAEQDGKEESTSEEEASKEGQKKH